MTPIESKIINALAVEHLYNVAHAVIITAAVPTMAGILALLFVYFSLKHKDH